MPTHTMAMLFESSDLQALALAQPTLGLAKADRESTRSTLWDVFVHRHDAAPGCWCYLPSASKDSHMQQKIAKMIQDAIFRHSI